MIKSVKIDPKGTHFPCAWLGKVKQLRKNAEFTFEPGLNIILGPNGSGKSTLTRSIARLFYAEQGGRTTLTQSAFMDAYKTLRDDPPEEFFTVDHDGGPLFYVNQEDTVGLSHGNFDDDFFSDGLARTFDKMSSGQDSCTNINRILILAEEYVKGGEPVDNRLENSNDLYQKRVRMAMAFLKPDRNSVPTLIMDEPDASLDLLNEAKVWDVIRTIAKKLQVIVCTHSVFALQSEAHFIEMEKGYRDKCLRAAAKLKI
jgi:energy-coupling factor transporter ATP-binding protein EcfA2